MLSKIRVGIIQESLTHYRIPVFKKIASHPLIDFTLVHGMSENESIGETSLKNGDMIMPFRVVSGPLKEYWILGKRVLWHKPSVELIKKEDFDVVIHQFETKFASLWKVKSIQHRKRKKFILWGIGGSLNRTPLLDLLRYRMACMSDAIVFYGKANRDRYLEMGIEHQKMFVARNSIDLDPIDHAISEWTAERLGAFRREKQLDKGLVLFTVGRLIERKRFDLLIKAASLIRPDFPGLKVIITGDGPEDGTLRALTGRLQMEDSVLFTGRIIGEAELAPWFLSSDLVVAPAQVGLLATQAHTYGRPLVACDDQRIQGPEIEVLIPGKTGAVYSSGDVQDLSRVLKLLLTDSDKRRILGKAAIQRVHEEFGIPNMVNGFFRGISHVTGSRLELFD
ncbi:MAG: glycosyltransferase family 4 protein [Deltaproteobacteria bacterium]|nr:glycosyltransferase family 4 protein [Deltaproteobacteria bacterium]